MNITQRMYFGQSPLDKDRNRRIAFYGRVSTQHEAQVALSEIKCSGMTISSATIPSGKL